MADAVAALLGILDIEQLEHNLYRGRSPQVGWQRVFGGLVISQSLVAATRTVGPDRRVHSLHAFFLRGGDPKIPILYEVDRIRDGKSFATRRAVAIQHGQAIFSLSASYHREEEGFSHQPTMPDVPGPDEVPSEDEFRVEAMHEMAPVIRDYWEHERPIEMRPVTQAGDSQNGDWLGRHEGPVRPRSVWIRAAGALPESRVMHEAVLAYASDMTLLDTVLVAHGRSVFEPAIQAASLDHAMWFHAPFRADDWLLYHQESPFAGGARGFARGQVWRRDGTLVASVAQEGLVRVRR